MPARKIPKNNPPHQAGLKLKETLPLYQYMVGTFPVPDSIRALPLGVRTDTIRPEEGQPHYISFNRTETSIWISYRGVKSYSLDDSEADPEEYARIFDPKRNSAFRFIWDIASGDKMQVYILINQRARDYSKLKNQDDAEFAALERIIRDPAPGEQWQASEGAEWLCIQFLQAIRDRAAGKAGAPSLRSFGEKLDARLEQLAKVEATAAESISETGWSTIRDSNWSKDEMAVCQGLAEMMVGIFRPPASPLPSRKGLIEHLKKTTRKSHSYDTVKPALEKLGLGWVS